VQWPFFVFVPDATIKLGTIGVAALGMVLPGDRCHDSRLQSKLPLDGYLVMFGVGMVHVPSETMPLTA